MAYQFSFENYGVKIGVRSDDDEKINEIENRIGEILPGVVRLIEPREAVHIFEVETQKNGSFKIYKNGENIAGGGAQAFFDSINSPIRLTVAEFAVGKVFLHAGVVGWKDKAVVIPASSFAGKTTLVAALIKKGALYYSDEYAVLDHDGSVSPFPKSLSVRGIVDDVTQIERTAQSLGGSTGEKAIPVGLVLICKYEKRKSGEPFAPEILSAGQGMLEILAHAIPIRSSPKFTLDTLQKITSRATIAGCRRGEADAFADSLIGFLNRTF